MVDRNGSVVASRWGEPLPLRGGAALPHRIMPGPMEGIMSPLFVGAMEDMDLIDYWISPFIRVTTDVPGRRALRNSLRPFDPHGKRPLIAQIMGTSPTLLASTAKALSDHFPIAGINVNFACPSRRVLMKNSGGKLLKTPDRIHAILRAIRDRCPDISLSVKTRSGFDGSVAMEPIFTALADHALDFIAFHYRTVRESYSPAAGSIERTRRAVELANGVPLFASGDVFSVDDALRHAETGCAGVVVARGLLRNPFLTRHILETIDHNAGVDAPEADRRREFLNALLVKINATPETYWSRNNFLELIKCMWGRDHEVFKHFISLSDEEIRENTNGRVYDPR